MVGPRLSSHTVEGDKRRRGRSGGAGRGPAAGAWRLAGARRWGGSSVVPAPTCAPQPASRASCRRLPGAAALSLSRPCERRPRAAPPSPARPLTPAPRAPRGCSDRTLHGGYTGASSSCSWVPTPACHALLGPAGRWTLTGMVPSSQTPAPRGTSALPGFCPQGGPYECQRNGQVPG